METLLKKFNLEPRIRDSLEKAGIYTITSVLAASERDLLTRADLSLEDIKKIRSLALSTAYYPQRASTLLNVGNSSMPRWWAHRRPIGCPILDRFLKGGFPSRGILEVSGESGSGKTQLCLQAALSAQVPSIQTNGKPLGTVYICTEDPFPSNRLMQIIQSYPERCPEAKGCSFGDKIFIEHVCDLAGLKECLQGRVPHLLRTSSIAFGLLVVDSIAGVFRGSTDYDGNETDEQGKSFASSIRSRAMDLKEIGGELHSLASSHGLSVICINQVSDAVNGIQGFGCNRKVPALGLAWANMITTRLIASRTNDYCNINRDSGKGEIVSDHERTIIRELEVIFSPELPPSKCRYTIISSGVVGIE